jgi:hypothetical protein
MGCFRAVSCGVVKFAFLEVAIMRGEVIGADRKDKKMNLFPLGVYQYIPGGRTLSATTEQAADSLRYVRALVRIINKYSKQ